MKIHSGNSRTANSSMTNNSTNDLNNSAVFFQTQFSLSNEKSTLIPSNFVRNPSPRKRINNTFNSNEAGEQSQTDIQYYKKEIELLQNEIRPLRVQLLKLENQIANERKKNDNLNQKFNSDFSKKEERRHKISKNVKKQILYDNLIDQRKIIENYISRNSIANLKYEIESDIQFIEDSQQQCLEYERKIQKKLRKIGQIKTSELYINVQKQEKQISDLRLSIMDSIENYKKKKHKYYELSSNKKKGENHESSKEIQNLEINLSLTLAKKKEVENSYKETLLKHQKEVKEMREKHEEFLKKEKNRQREVLTVIDREQNHLTSKSNSNDQRKKDPERKISYYNHKSFNSSLAHEEKTIYIGLFSKRIEYKILEKIFSKHGEILSISINPVDLDPPAPYYAEIEYSSRSEAQYAILRENNKKIGKELIIVKWASKNEFKKIIKDVQNPTKNPKQQD